MRVTNISEDIVSSLIWNDIVACGDYNWLNNDTILIAVNQDCSIKIYSNILIHFLAQKDMMIDRIIYNNFRDRFIFKIF